MSNNQPSKVTMLRLNYLQGANPKHLKFAEKVWKNTDDFIDAKLRGNRGMKFKHIKNDAQLCVTRTGIYTDSFPKMYGPSVDRICRLRVSAISELLLNDLKNHHDSKKDVIKHFKKGKIRIHGCSVNLNTFAVQSLYTVSKLRGYKIPKCECCGIEAKYAYVEANISITESANPSKRVVKRNYILAFYGVKENGIELRMTVDHILAQANGGKDVPSNLQIMCSSCNSLKASIPDDIFFKHRGAIEMLIAQDTKNNH